MIFRSPWNAFPDVPVQTTVAKLKSHPDYEAAKHGDQDAALRVIAQVFKPGKVTGSCDLIVPVLQLDQGKQNMLPVAYALRLGRELGAEVFLGISQSNQVSHSGADAITRNWDNPRFGPHRARAPGRYCGRCRYLRLYARKLARLEALKPRAVQCPSGKGIIMEGEFGYQSQPGARVAPEATTLLHCEASFGLVS